MMSPRAYSFDVFDTALVRTWARPADLFLGLGGDLGRRKMISISAAEWLGTRVQAETEARKRARPGEVTLEGIYQILAEKLGWNTEIRDEAARLEIAHEAAALRPVAMISDRIKALRKEGARIIFLSDMYLSTETIRGFLTENGLWEEGDGLYVSGECGGAKGNGLLYELCLGRESLAPRELYHTGDNENSDFSIPKSLKIKAEVFRGAALNRFEKRILNNARLPTLFRSRLAGASRTVRLSFAAHDPKTMTITAVSASVTAPVLLGYVFWCMSEAEKQGIRRLYFISRDGQILCRIAERLRAAWGFNVECRYLFGSRQAFHLPALEDFGEREFDWLLEETSFLSVRSLFGRLGATPQELKDELSAAGFPPERWDVNMAVKERMRLRPVFDRPVVRDFVMGKATESRQGLTGYLEQEGLLGGTSWGLVDMGWRGRLQNSLGRLLDRAGAYPSTGISGFYFALFEPAAPFGRDRLIAYLDRIGEKKAKSLIWNYIPVFEVFTAADHGLTLGFQRGMDGRFTPALGEAWNEKALAWGLRLQQTAVLKFAQEFTLGLERRDISAADFLAASQDLLNLFLKNPSAEEAAAYGDFLFSEDQAEQSYDKLAPSIKARQFWSWYFFKGPLVASVTWVEASIRRSLRGADFFLTLVRIKRAVRKYFTGGRRL